MAKQFKNILMIGATSGIAVETAQALCDGGPSFYLVGRDEYRLEQTKTALLAAGAAKVETLAADFLDFNRHQALIAGAIEALTTIDLAVIAHGELTPNEAEFLDFAVQEKVIRLNFLSVISLFDQIAKVMVLRKAGTIAIFGSVAGDRGKKRNFIYGVAKSALHAFASGERNYLHSHGVHVCTIKPGLTDTKMARDNGFKKGAPPVKVGRQIASRLKRGADVIYTPRRWAFFMLFIRLIPERIFKRLSL